MSHSNCYFPEVKDSLDHAEVCLAGPRPAQHQPAGGPGGRGRGGGREWRGVGRQLDIQVCHRVLLRMTFEQGTDFLWRILALKLDMFSSLKSASSFTATSRANLTELCSKRSPGKLQRRYSILSLVRRWRDSTLRSLTGK